MTAGPAEDTRTRLLHTALRLFTEHGVEGTSLQMIADALGITKAAVYYHFKTKAELTEAVAEPGIRDLDELVLRAGAQKRRGAQVDLLLEGFVDLVVRHRTLVALFSSDPGLIRAIEKSAHGGMEGFGQALLGILSGPAPDTTSRVNAMVALTGIAMAGGSPDLASLDDEELRTELLDVGRRLLGRPRRRTHLPVSTL
ncbi:TetR family transcriptional regulator [Amycolatopsis sp., V23-08]|uniref:TetR family transcriptional regulator n=1 Tax=Amycolatopsis heterodermiae TaxID=3110235 RepID=A0ABU5REK1_9PSEU|nr:TetR family transcriptional regulator [Amycolatopsis sp., V23-08]MEA5364703.1 TetR family transcriptional regulator [Amycolatopsis sp., V23-08]